MQKATNKGRPKYRSVKWLKQHYGVKSPTIYFWLYSHKLPAYKIGRTVLVREDDFVQFIEKHREEKRT